MKQARRLAGVPPDARHVAVVDPVVEGDDECHCLRIVNGHTSLAVDRDKDVPQRCCGGGLALGMTEFAYPLVSRSGLEPPAGLREETP